MTKRRREILLQSALEGMSVGKIVERTGLSHRTVFDFLARPEVAEELARHRRIQHDHHRRMLDAKVDAAVSTLVVGMAGGLKADRQLRAAESVLDRVGLGRTGAQPLVNVESSDAPVVAVLPTSSATDFFEGRTEAEIEHYAEHGRFPEPR